MTASKERILAELEEVKEQLSYIESWCETSIKGYAHHAVELASDAVRHAINLVNASEERKASE